GVLRAVGIDFKFRVAPAATAQIIAPLGGVRRTVHGAIELVVPDEDRRRLARFQLPQAQERALPPPSAVLPSAHAGTPRPQVNQHGIAPFDRGAVERVRASGAAIPIGPAPSKTPARSGAPPEIVSWSPW